MRLAVLFSLAFISSECLAQKPEIDYSVIKNWPSIGISAISNDGQFVLYSIRSLNSSKIIIHSTTDGIEREFYLPNTSWPKSGFTEGNHFAVFLKGNDSLCIWELRNKTETMVPNCLSFKTSKKFSSDQIAYLLKDKSLVLLDLVSGERKTYSNVMDYLFADNGIMVILRKSNLSDKDIEKQVVVVFPEQSKEIVVAERKNPLSFGFDNSATQLAFISKDGQMRNSIWYYRVGMDSAVERVNNELVGSDKYKISAEELHFSPNGDKLFFKVMKSVIDKRKDSSASSVDIWNYKDRFLQPEQQKNFESDKNRSYRAVFHFKSNKVVVLENDTFRRVFRLNLNEGNNDDFLLAEGAVNTWESYRLPNERPNLFLVNTDDGRQRCLLEKTGFIQASFSPGGRFVYWYNQEIGAYFTYNITTGKISNVTHNLPTSLYESESGKPSNSIPFGIAYWAPKDKAIYIYDKYDIWQIDPSGQISPQNITKVYGRSHNVVLRVVRCSNNDDKNKIVINKDSSILLCGFDLKTKENGFFKLAMDKKESPNLLVMSSDVYYCPSNFSYVTFPTFLLKAKYSGVYLLSRMNTAEYPNLITTMDFKEFTRISNLEPQKKYNWLTSELVTWRTFDNRWAEGVLYKPENFNPHKKYPVIFSLYERFSDGLNMFKEPNLCSGPINIPLFVSRGYLVFCPDIYYTIGNPGGSVYNYVVSAVKSISRKPWVNPQKIGVQGHSFGAFEVNDIITKTTVFAAAASAEGATNLTSYAGTLKLNNLDGHTFVEIGQMRMGASLWNLPLNYINNSPVFNANKISTPLLIMHNKNDFGVAWTQGIEFFTALRRLRKKVWMLQYDQGEHELYNEIDQLDYTKRLLQYFDHFLKDSLQPKWMAVGIKANEKKIDLGFEMESLKH